MFEVLLIYRLPERENDGILLLLRQVFNTNWQLSGNKSNWMMIMTIDDK